MTVFRAFGQDTGPTLQIGFAAFPAGSTLLRARLSVETWFASQNSTFTIQQAPPNTLMGVSWRPSGTAPELITESNWSDATWYMAGLGRLIASDRWTYIDAGVTPAAVYVQHVYSQDMDLEAANYQAAAQSAGISINWLGSGFWSSNESFLTYDLTIWYD